MNGFYLETIFVSGMHDDLRYADSDMRLGKKKRYPKKKRQHWQRGDNEGQTEKRGRMREWVSRRFYQVFFAQRFDRSEIFNIETDQIFSLLYS